MTLAKVRQELDQLAERRLYKPFTDRDARRWDELIRLEQELLGISLEPDD